MTHKSKDKNVGNFITHSNTNPKATWENIIDCYKFFIKIQG